MKIMTYISLKCNMINDFYKFQNNNNDNNNNNNNKNNNENNNRIE